MSRGGGRLGLNLRWRGVLGKCWDCWESRVVEEVNLKSVVEGRASAGGMGPWQRKVDEGKCMGVLGPG